MFETVVIATDGSESAGRAVEVALDLAARFEADVHALYVIDETEIEATPAEVREDLQTALTTAGGQAVTFVREQVTGETGADCEVVTAVREGDPDDEIIEYAEDEGADLIATGTRGRHGEHSFLLGSVAEAVVRRSPIPVLTVRQLEAGETAPETP